MFFVGIDLAWSDSNPTGLALIEGGRESGSLVSTELVETDEEIVGWVEEKVAGSEAVLAVDAPLTVPNETGRRPAEEVVGKLFSRYDAGAHPANRNRLSQWSGRVRGEDIVEKLGEKGFHHDPYLDLHEECRKIVEVYPHPAMVTIFDLERILRYKKKPGRNYDFLWGEFERYQENIRGLSEEEPSLSKPDLAEKDVQGLRGSGLKEYEDKLDALFCAYTGYYYWANPDRCEVLGTEEGGYILTPLKPEMEEKLEEIRSQKDLGSF